MYRLHIDARQRYGKKVALFKNDESVWTKEGDAPVSVLVRDVLKETHVKMEDILDVTFEQGPGSFTGLKLSSVVANTINWGAGKKQLKDLKYPEYGAEPNIQSPNP